MFDTGVVDEPQPAIPSSRPNGQPPDVYQQLVEAVQRFRARKVWRTPSALVRWVLLVAAIGVGTALLIALVVQVLVSQLPGGG
jgi:hypothetical protein